ncbi:MAG: tRNA (adenosine(37)-N6)-threonylcarbamoyltransferase complex dimerization subunit type 1 TsaB [Anaerolineae bacterium]|nr:tRNA (adenosine(37)-N6)-threonylcarbamoyltransferase complex dimerization subunit type 1 TsaB [Anaerolineae bacterium]
MLLAIDTASQFMSLALHDGRQIGYEATWRSRNNHTVELAPAIRAALASAGQALGDLSAIAVAQGPGSFTGLRIGLGVAKGLAQARGLPLVAIPTLEIVAAGVPPLGSRLIAVLQVGRGRLCAQPFAWAGAGWTGDGPAEITTWARTLDTVRGETLVAGEIDDAGRALLDATDRPVRAVPGAYALRRAGMLAELAWSRVAAGATDDPALVTPIYLHQPGVPHP